MSVTRYETGVRAVAVVRAYDDVVRSSPVYRVHILVIPNDQVADAVLRLGRAQPVHDLQVDPREPDGLRHVSGAIVEVEDREVTEDFSLRGG